MENTLKNLLNENEMKCILTEVSVNKLLEMKEELEEQRLQLITYKRFYNQINNRINELYEKDMNMTLNEFLELAKLEKQKEELEVYLYVESNSDSSILVDGIDEVINETVNNIRLDNFKTEQEEIKPPQHGTYKFDEEYYNYSNYSKNEALRLKRTDYIEYLKYEARANNMTVEDYLVSLLRKRVKGKSELREKRKRAKEIGLSLGEYLFRLEQIEQMIKKKNK